MIEGWHNNDYLVLFDDAQVPDITERYGLGEWIAGYHIVGLCGWDDFILRDDSGTLFRIPTVPVDKAHIRPLGFSIDRKKLVPDKRFVGKIKWYTQPVVFGGNPSSNENVTWVDIPRHIEFVRWWNRQYFELVNKGKEEKGSGNK